MIGYGPRAEDMREALGLPYATGADDPDYWHPVDTAPTGASGAGLPGTFMQPSDPAELALLHMTLPGGASCT